ncbi:YidH family protein [Williamsia sp. MIQD14]|uniref:YidH family protein n=1 Tax=Williamsia sp. MIQD14 TaxID=3425703 RepID=UPI003DA10C91
MTEPETPREHRPAGAVDARFTLAAERTVLAWIRTALGLIAAGMAVLHVLPDFSSSGVRDVVGIGLIALGAGAAVAGGVRWRRTTVALRDGAPMPGPGHVWVVIVGVVVLSLIAVVAGLAA